MIRYRALTHNDAQYLEDFLYLALHQTDPSHPFARSIVRRPELSIYTRNWGRAGDIGVVATTGVVGDSSPSSENIIGIAWARSLGGPIPGYGNLDEDTPELSIAIKQQFRGAGVGSELLRHLTQRLAVQGYSRVSLSVQKTNPAHRLYLREGFIVHEERGDDWVMILDLRNL